MNIILITAIFLALFIIVEFLQRKTKMDREYSRKLAHFFSAVIAFFLPYYLNREMIIGLAIFFALFLLATRFSGLFPSIHKVNRQTLGEIYFPIGIGLSAYFFLPNSLIAFQFGVLVLGISDTVAALVGNLLGSRRTKLLGDKSREGTIAFFLSTFLIFIFLVPLKIHTFLLGVLISLIIAFIELVLDGGFDNLFLPLISGFLLKLLTGI